MTLILPILLFVGTIFGVASGQTALVDDWAVKSVEAVILCIFIGLFEELTFRAVVNDALLYRFRNSKHIFLWIAVISSLVFGFVHVAGGSIGSSEAVVSAILKTVSTAIAGLCFLILYWKTRNIWGVALLHCIDDACSFISQSITEEKTAVIDANAYVNAGLGGIVVYVIQILLSLVALIVIWRKVGRTIDFEEIRRTW